MHKGNVMKTTRREFLAATAAGPLLLGLQDKAGSKAPVLGQGAFTYEADHDWGALPASSSLVRRTPGARAPDSLRSRAPCP